MSWIDTAKTAVMPAVGLNQGIARAIMNPQQTANNVAGFVNNPLGTVRGEAQSVQDQVQGLGAGISGAAKGIIPQNNFAPIMPMNTFAANMPTNTFNPNMPMNAYQAATPQFAHTDFATALQGAMANPYAGPSLGNAGAIGNQQGDFASALMGRSGQTYGQQQGLINQLQGQALGQGPGSMLGQNMINQATDANIKQGAGMIASQKGINPALAARLIAQNTGAMNQNAAAQGANLGLQQQLAAQQQLGGMLGQQQGLDTSQAAGLLGTQRGQDISGALGVGGLGLQQLSTLAGAAGQQAGLDVNAQQGANALNAGVAAGNQQAGIAGQQMLGDVARGNQNAGIAGQQIDANVAAGNQNAGVAGQQIQAGVAAGNQAAKSAVLGSVMNAAGSMGAAALNNGGTVPATSSYGQGYSAGEPDIGNVPMTANQGAKVPGRAKVKGDSPKNDTVDAKLSPGEVVIPRSAANDPEKAAAFVAALKGGDKKSSGAKGYGKILEKHRELQTKMKELEALIKRSA